MDEDLTQCLNFKLKTTYPSTYHYSMLPETLSYKAFHKLTEPCLSDPILHRSLKMSVPVGTCAVAGTPLYISNIHLKLRETDM